LAVKTTSVGLVDVDVVVERPSISSLSSNFVFLALLRFFISASLARTPAVVGV
jgi:hypothetical protein